MLAILGTVLSAILSGGATGLLGVIIQRYFDFKSKAQDLELLKINNEHALAMQDKEIEKTKAEWDARKSIANTDMLARMDEAAKELQARQDEAAAMTQQASYDHDKATYLTSAVLRSKSRVAVWLMALIDFTRGLIRPALTAYLVVITHLMYLDMARLISSQGERLEAVMAKELLVQVLSTILYLATVAVVWWFGTRPPNQPPRK